ncbi:major facilitator superfamily domain-containing protein [Phialemonium atrogriseum]|uniref:Major facilitator superfamily domain-containing protein n=1 Tax=Phialemonium atrogriseum TaxID=1093897 RepID=A0AAJ0BSB0_9PEZI|nr:major facilitator superfamily domain-containing protein [Phialemonium atrogriseum]KAK1763360.1 major facilitator superfamily domain-containing protein [Phialemonium atrogriseum]
MQSPSQQASSTALSENERHGIGDTSLPLPEMAAPNSKEEETKTREISSDSSTDDLEPQWISGLPLVNMMVALSIVMFLVLLDGSIIGTAIPRITSEFHSLEDVGWYGSAFQLASAALGPLTGKIYATCDKKWTFIWFFAIFEVGSLLCGVAVSSNMLIVGRAVAGMGVAGLQNGGLTIVASAVSLQRRASLNGILVGLSQLGIVMGPLIGGAFTSYSTWRWCFYINLPLGAVVAVALFFVRIPEQKATGKSERLSAKARALIRDLDLLGFTLLTGFAIELLLALQWGGSSYAWNSSVVIGLLCGAAVTLVLFLFWEHRKGDEAMIPFSIMTKRVVWCGCLVYGFLMASLFLLTYYLPIYFQSVLNATAILSGVYTLPNILAQLAAAIISGLLVGRLGYYLPWSIASAIMTSISTGLMSTFDVNTPAGKWVGYQILFGAGCGMGIQMPILAAQNSLAAQYIPIAIATLIFAQNMVTAIWLTIASTIFENSLRTLIVEYAPSVDAEVVINAGATGIRDVVPAGPVLTQVLAAYSKAIDNTFYLSTASLAASLLFVWGTGWKDIRKKKETSLS